MRRSGPTRRTPVRPSTKPLKRSEPSRARTRIRSRGGKRFPKGYDRAERERIASLPCLLRGKAAHECGPSEPAHVRADGVGAGDRGNMLPLCANAHRLGPHNFHAGRHSFAKYWGFGDFAALQAIAAELGESRD